MSSNDIEENLSQESIDEKSSSEPAGAVEAARSSDEVVAPKLSPELQKARDTIMSILGAPENPAKTVDERLKRKVGNISKLLREKEELKLSYVNVEVPKPYYDIWRIESNEIFSQAVRLDQRRRQLEELKKQKEAADSAAEDSKTKDKESTSAA